MFWMKMRCITIKSLVCACALATTLQTKAACDSCSGQFEPGHWYGTFASGCETADFDEVLAYAGSNNIPLLVLLGNKQCRYCHDIQTSIENSGGTSDRNAIFYNCYEDTPAALYASRPYVWAAKAADPDNMGRSWTQPIVVAYWKKTNGETILRSKSYFQRLNGESFKPNTTADAEAMVDELTTSCYIRFSYSKDLQIIPKGESIGELPEPSAENKVFLGWFSAVQGGERYYSGDIVREDVTLYSHWRNLDGSVTIKAEVASGQEDFGKISGANKNFYPGMTARVTVTPAKGVAFKGWFVGGRRVSEEPSFNYPVPDSDVTLEARFITPADDWLEIETRGFSFDRSSIWADLEDFLSVDSGSAAAVKVSGLPSGIKYDAKTNKFSGRFSKDGVYYVSFSASNKTGYKQTVISKWTVGHGYNGDYDDIGVFNGWDGFEPKTGEWDDFIMLTEDEDALSLSVSGLPAGIKEYKPESIPACPCQYKTFSGTYSKAGVYKMTVSVRYRNGRTKKAQKTIVVQGGVPRHLNVVSSDTSRGTVTGSGVYEAGAAARISAKPARGYFFSGWCVDEAATEYFEGPDSGEYWNESDRVTISEGTPQRIYARFITKDEDEIGMQAWGANDNCFSEDEDWAWEIDTSAWRPWLELETWSETRSKVTAKGIQSGLKFEKTEYGTYRLYVTDTAKLNPGTSEVVFTIKTATGLTKTKKVKIFTPNLRSSAFYDLDYSQEGYRMTQGVNGVVSASFSPQYKITATGLPPGLKLAASGGQLSIYGAPTKAGTHTVALNAKSSWETAKATISITVDPLPEYAIGSFNGIIASDDFNDVAGRITFSASRTGTLSAKITTRDGTFSFSSKAWNAIEDGALMATFEKKVQGESTSLSLKLAANPAWNDARQIEGSFQMIYDTYRIKWLQRDPFASGSGSSDEAKSIASTLARAGKLGLVEEERYDNVYADGSAPITVTVNKNGKTLMSGRRRSVADSSMISASSVLMFDGDKVFTVFVPIMRLRAPGGFMVTASPFTFVF